MTNLFENVKFGDKFPVKDGRVAIYGFVRDGRHWMMVEDIKAIITYNDDGVSDYPNDKLDIINERKEKKEKYLYETDIPWWWYFWHPIDALEISHYGRLCVLTDKDHYKGLKLK